MLPFSMNELPILVVLDTDIFSLLFHNDVVAEKVRTRIAALPQGIVCLSAVTAEEVLRGALARIREQETRGRPQTGYELLTALILEVAT